MKNKLILLCLIFSIILTGCGKKNKQDITEHTSDITTTIEKQDDKKEIPNINIFTKDIEIPYEKFIKNKNNIEDDEKYTTQIKDFIDENKLSAIPQNTEIRIDFNSFDIDKIKDISLNKIYVKQDKEYTFETKGTIQKIDENGFINFEHNYDNKDQYLKVIIYEVIVELEDTIYKYVFSFKIDNKIEEDIKPSSLTGYLTQDEQKVYDSYKKDKDVKILKDKEPLTMLKFYTQAIMEEDYSIAYSLYQDYKQEGMTEENYIKAMESFSKETKDDYISNLKSAVNGKFIEDSKEKGYIEYEITEDHPMAIDMVKDKNGIWKMQYIPIQ